MTGRQSRKAEARKGAAGQGDLAGVVEYLAQRGQDLQRYSDRLREAVHRIENYLTELARECGIRSHQVILEDADIDWMGRNQYGYIMQLRKAKGHWWLFFDFYLTIGPDGPERVVDDPLLVSEVPRRILKEAVKQLPAFIRQYAQTLGVKAEQYREVAEVAEKMAACLPGGAD